MTIKAKYMHTNLIARNWKKLTGFYAKVFGCIPIPPEREYEGKDIENGTGVPDVQIRGVHLRLPGYNGEGPTLEIFQYNNEAKRPETAINRPGFAHIAFAVDDVEAAKAAVLEAGGGVVGKVVSLDVPEAGTVTFTYLTDPEGNIIELQRWSR